MSSAKTKVTPQTPFSEAAHAGLRRTLGQVRRHARRARKEGCCQPESIHRLRVATRRSQVAIDLFANSLPGQLSGRIRGNLTRLRRGAGKLRDLDVLLDRWLRADASDRVPRSVMQFVSRRRDKAVEQMKATLKGTRKGGLEKQLKRLVRKIRWRGAGSEPTFGEAATRLIQPIGAAFFQRGLHPIDDYDDLHQFRIAGKKLRYAFGTLSAGLDPGVVARQTGRLSELQEQLGQLNDHHSGWLRLQKWAQRAGDRKLREGLEALAAREWEARNQLQSTLLAEWNRDGILAWEHEFQLDLAAPAGS